MFYSNTNVSINIMINIFPIHTSRNQAPAPKDIPEQNPLQELVPPGGAVISTPESPMNSTSHEHSNYNHQWTASYVKVCFCVCVTLLFSCRCFFQYIFFNILWLLQGPYHCNVQYLKDSWPRLYKKMSVTTMQNIYIL